MHLGVFGGSFDPVHFGHLIVAAEAHRRLGLDRVVWVPVGRQPLKPAGPRAAAGDRLTMLRLAIEGDDRFEVDGREIARPGPSYTVDTLRALRAERPADRLSLLVGADAAVHLPAWREADALFALAAIVILTRPGVPVPPHGAAARVLEVPRIDISASAIRARCRERASIRYLVPEPVRRFIRDRGLYTEGD